ncbi:unnamed protein product [Cylindrotheca closterium]|uniref:Leucine-rich repeat domain-containing protein n=1 Tax=Cylindrotheca closterium TaxID=2856 RepID=A0AAD2FPR0_9STRA|nr:unnamed protein product [Cylindrotheca closterium]
MEANEYRYRGNAGEKVPNWVHKLTFDPGIQVLPSELCNECIFLEEVALPEGLIKIGRRAFEYCTSLSEIKIRGTVESVWEEAFTDCSAMTKVEFEESCSSSSPPHGLKTIFKEAFQRCRSLQRIKIPSSVNLIGDSCFQSCDNLIEATLSTTSIKEIPRLGFAHCRSLQTVSLPSSLERVCDYGFYKCPSLVTVVIVPLDDSKPIEIGFQSFESCEALANFVLPTGSNADNTSFDGCARLQSRFGERAKKIVAGLISRFDSQPVHKMLYDWSSVSPKKLGHCIETAKSEESPLVDRFGMTPFHIFFSTNEPDEEVLEVLLDKYPYHVVNYKDSNGKRPLDYLVSNWTEDTESLLAESTATLLQKTMQRWMIDPLVRWGTASWVEDMQSKVEGILAEYDNEQREVLYNGAYSVFLHYVDMTVPSILEMALWKAKLNGGRNTDIIMLQSLDREECRCVCGSDVVIPSVAIFLGIIP